MLRFQDYRRRLLRSAIAFFSSRGLSVREKERHILDSWECWPDNLIDPGWARLVTEERGRRQERGEGFPLHKYLHHGLSSQAMLFNLVLPLLERDDVDALAPAFEEAGVPWPGPGASARLEVEDRATFAEQQQQPTSFDLAIEGPSGPPIFVEAKLVEREFGGCSLLEGGDCEGANPAGDFSRCPLHRWGRLYWERLEELGFLRGALAEGPICPLGTYYQFFREAAFALLHGGYYVLLVHGDNPAFWREEDGAVRGLWPFLVGLVPPEHRHRLHRVILQDAARAIAATGRHDDWIGTFSERYALEGRAAALEEGPEPPDPETALASLPPAVSQAIHELWGRLSALEPGRGGAALQRRISRTLLDAGVEHGDPRWRAIIEHGRRLYRG